MRMVDVLVDKKFIDDLRENIRLGGDIDDDGILFCGYVEDRDYKVKVRWPEPSINIAKFYIVDPDGWENKDFFLFREEFTVPPNVVKLPKELFEI
jgi:hypothetical protein